MSLITPDIWRTLNRRTRSAVLTVLRRKQLVEDDVALVKVWQILPGLVALFVVIQIDRFGGYPALRTDGTLSTTTRYAVGWWWE